MWNLRFQGNAQQQRPAAATGDEAPPPQQGGGGQEAAAGTYRVRLTVNGRSYEGSVRVREDPDAAAILGRQ
jgi:hypothetical protein